MEMERKWKKNEEMERGWKWGEREFLPLHFLSFSPFPHFPLISSQFTAFVSSVAKILTFNEEIILDQNRLPHTCIGLSQTMTNDGVCVGVRVKRWPLLLVATSGLADDISSIFTNLSTALFPLVFLILSVKYICLHLIIYVFVAYQNP